MAAGGLGGRLIASVLTDFYGWRTGLALESGSVGVSGPARGCTVVAKPCVIFQSA